jgi:hypothetical protein
MFHCVLSCLGVSSMFFWADLKLENVLIDADGYPVVSVFVPVQVRTDDYCSWMLFTLDR